MKVVFIKPVNFHSTISQDIDRFHRMYRVLFLTTGKRYVIDEDRFYYEQQYCYNP